MIPNPSRANIKTISIPPHAVKSHCNGATVQDVTEVIISELVQVREPTIFGELVTPRGV